MKRLKIIALAASALFVGGLREQYCTANVNDRGVSPGDRPKNEMVELLCKGAGVDPADVYWRVSRGLSPKQAVDVAAQEKFEGEVESLAKKLKDKLDSEIRDLAKKAKIDSIQDLSRQQLLIALARAERAGAGTPMPGEESPPQSAGDTPASTPSAKPIEEMDFAELKAEAAKRQVDIKGLKSKAQVLAALNK